MNEVAPTFTWKARVRVYECDTLRHVNNAVYLHYLQQATAEAWSELGSGAWELRSLAMEYLAPARSGDDLEVAVWADGVSDGLLACEYAITRSDDAQGVLRTRAAWSVPDDAHGIVPASVWPSAPADLVRTAPLRLKSGCLDAHRYRWRHTIRHYELDASGFVNPIHLLRWLEEARMVACAEAGWPFDRLYDADVVVVQLRHDSQFYSRLRVGETVEVVSSICELRLLKGAWLHEVRRLSGGCGSDGVEDELVALDYSSGAFLNRAVRPQPPPKAILDALLQGPDDG